MPDSTYIKSGIEYDFTVKIINNNTPNKDIVFNFAANSLLEVCIEDNFFNWYVRGFITYVNTQETVERGDEQEKYQPYKFRSDGYDVAIISIKPKNTPDYFLLEYKVAIYDVEDMPPKDNVGKIKKLFFRDLDYQLMIDRNLSWSNMDHDKFKDLKKDEKMSLSNWERGLLGHELLELHLQKCGLDKYIDRDNWRESTVKHRIYYTSPSQNTMIDDLDFILDQCIAEEDADYCPLIFKKDKTTETKKNGKFTLLPIKEYFERAQPKDLFIENFYLQHPGTDIVIPKTPDANETLYQSVILAYQYAQTSGADNSQAYQIKPQSFYSHGGGQFNWDITWNTPIIAKRYLAEKMVKYLKQKGDPLENTLVVLNEWKKKQSYTLEPRANFINNRYGRLIDGRNMLTDAMLGLNDTITFDARGLTKRQAGRFIGIDIQLGKDGIDFDNRLCGVWLITKLTHLFTRSDYVNSIECMKIYTYENKKPIVEELDPAELIQDGWPDE